MYMFGGYNTEFFKDMIIFNTITFKYSYGSIINGPPCMYGYTATLLPNGIVMYIGGRVRNSDVTTINLIKNITMYNINEDSWNYTIAKSQNNVQDRCYHSAVLTSDGRIICYGGISISDKTISPSLIVLNTTSFEWRSPEYSGANEPPNICYHSANLVENYMIIGFGNVSESNASPNIYMLDVRNYTWISYYDALSVTTVPPPSNVSDQHKPPLSVGAIIGISIGGAIVLGLLLFFGIRYYYRNKNPILYVPGSKE
ncbi:hypothetical protein Glove_21g160 [Diversispora epigaea]|uniref:Galactose oxidase n=1 Tax=Diversispora epigaea TaxID=1348612 RepID=A0A397JPN8_9GLOM|nr:hypothetical protein Glove_21g160 [Diversispora epigaea]